MKISRHEPEFIRHEFGGSLLKSSHAKIHRPISTSRPMHFVFRSDMANGTRSFLLKRNRLKIQKILKRHKILVRLHNFVIENEQIHLMMSSKNRKSTIKFLRIFSGLVARQMLHAEKAHAKIKKLHFWKFRPYSRTLVVKSYQLAKTIRTYLEQIEVLCSIASINSS